MEYQFNEFQSKWLEALESGEYKQGAGALFNNDLYCCLGVACAVLGMTRESNGKFTDAGGFAPINVQEAMRIDGGIGRINKSTPLGEQKATSLAEANDQGVTFSEIAAFIRSSPTAVFTE